MQVLFLYTQPRQNIKCPLRDINDDIYTKRKYYIHTYSIYYVAEKLFQVDLRKKHFSETLI